MSTDVDNPNDAWQVVAAAPRAPTASAPTQLTADGQWTYTLDNANAAVQALNDGDTLTDTFTVVTADGTTQLVTITIHGAERRRGDHRRRDRRRHRGRQRRQRHADRDRQSRLRPTSTTRTTPGGGGGRDRARIDGFGTYAVTADGQWTYTLDNTNAAVQALNGAATLTDTFNVVTADGTTQLVTITIHAQNDAAVITGDAAGAVTESPAAGPTAATSMPPTSTTPPTPGRRWRRAPRPRNGFGTYHADGERACGPTRSTTATPPCRRSTARDTLTDTFTVLTAGRHGAARHRHDPRRERRRGHHRHRGRRRHRGRQRQQRHADRDRQPRLHRRRQPERRMVRGGGRNRQHRRLRHLSR